MAVWLTTTSFSELLVRFLKGNSTSSDTTGTSIVSAHMDRAEATVMSALAARYTMPFTTVPPEARRLAQDIAAVYIIRASSYQDGKEMNKYLERFEYAFDDLKAIEQGARKLTLTDGSLVPTKTARFDSNTRNYTPVFGLDDPTSWGRDPDEVEDQADRREA